VGQPFLGEVKLISWNFPPKGWAFCNGQFLPINQNQALFSILGTMYGGDGRTTFALPDLRGRAAIHQGSGFTVGQNGGQEFHTLIISEMPAHNHIVTASDTQGDKNTVLGNILAREVGNPYGAFGSPTTLHPTTVSSVGGSQPHENRQPYLVVNFIIALQGVFPSQN
jgi:microcystin-dependent protein